MIFCANSQCRILGRPRSCIDRHWETQWHDCFQLMSGCRATSWQGTTVHTGIWKTSVEGPRMVRRLNIDGDRQGDLQGHGGERRAVFVYQMDSIGIGRTNWDDATSSTDSSERISPWTACQMQRCASETATGAVAPCSRSCSRRSPVTDWAFVSTAGNGRTGHQARKTRLLFPRVGGRGSRGRRRDYAGRVRAQAHERLRDK
jgi:hypothetical protein